MSFLDIIIVLFIISSIFRGYKIGLVRQAGSTIGFIAGLYLGAFIEGHVVSPASSSFGQTIASLLIVLGTSFVLMTLGEYIGIRLKVRLMRLHVDGIDGGLGSLMGVATMLIGVWLAANILLLAPSSGTQQIIKSSHIIAGLNRLLPPATQVLSELNRLINPNGFPQVFSGLEPRPKNYTAPSSLGDLRAAVQADSKSVVKVEGLGCGGIVEGSGFVIAKGEIVTNAHVVAGVKKPKVIDSNGTHDTKVVWFDPNVDVAVLRVSSLAGKPLVFNTAEQQAGTKSAAMGYPGGGNLSAQPATIMDHFEASGRNIYGQGNTVREVYSIAAKIIHGNSGGPLINVKGQVLGIVFATSTTYNDVGYALTAHQVAGELAQAEQSNTTVGTGSCSE